MKSSAPEIIDVSQQNWQELVCRLKQGPATDEDLSLLDNLRVSNQYLITAIGNKNANLARLRKALFGSSTEKTSHVTGHVGGHVGGGDPPSAAANDVPPDQVAGTAEQAAGDTGPSAEPSADAALETAASAASPAGDCETTTQTRERIKGHGRNGAERYPGARRVKLSVSSLRPGDKCSDCEVGTVYDMARPGVVIRFTGQSPVLPTIYELEKLRCNLCGRIFTAQAPPEVARAEKYDATAVSMVALMKYGIGVPFHRLDGFQEKLNVPLPASTQWDIVNEPVPQLQPVLEEMIRQAAQGQVVYNDDTTMKILSLMEGPAETASHPNNARDRAVEPPAAPQMETVPGVTAAAAVVAEDAAPPPERGPADGPAPDGQAEAATRRRKSGRKGLFTSGVVSTLSCGARIALFFTGRQHAGENLEDVLRKRATDLPPPIQMCDALSRNPSRAFQTILANCLAHGRRQFVDVHDQFPEECRYVLEALAEVYRVDADSRDRGLSAGERLVLHQTRSGPVMNRLHDWLERQLADRLVEPNSALGGAIRYMLRHWTKLSLFLRQAGAPLDNNLCERALKKCILHRKNALFYRTEHGAAVGDLSMSLIHTCELNRANPFDYLTALLRHAAAAAVNPAAWMPWNYPATLEPAAAAA